MPNDSLGDRIKSYEDVFRQHLPIRMPLIIRVDGKAFHTYTKGCVQPVDQNLVNCMNDTAKYLCTKIQGVQLAYVQSDEISLLINNYQNIDTQPLFDNNLQKIVSISAALASTCFTSLSHTIFGSTKVAIFDSRAFVLPKEDVNNAFLWRQQDALRNSVQSLARSLFSHKQCDNKNTLELKELCLTKNVDWSQCPISQQRGRCIIKTKVLKEGLNPKTKETFTAERTEWVVDNNIPIFSENINYINQYI